jgi:hypothetical protein
MAALDEFMAAAYAAGWPFDNRFRLACLPIPHRSLTLRESNASGGFMFVRSRKVQFAALLATALAVAMWPALGEAHTPEQEQACTGDAFRLCSSAIPNVDAVTVCMIRNKSQLSPGCRAVFRKEPAATTSVNAARPLSIKPAAARKRVGIKQRKAKKPAR